jgi:hypothetical protein
MLDPFNRALVALAALCVLGAVALAPSPARSFFSEAVPPPLQFPNAHRTEAAAILRIRRDPFAEPASKPVVSAIAPAPVAEQPSLSVGAGGPLPSNLQSETIPGLPGGSPDSGPSSAPKVSLQPGTDVRITAVVTGAHPFAMVESGGKHEIKGIGDRVGGIPIVAIDIDGLRLQNGGRLTVDPAAHL